MDEPRRLKDEAGSELERALLRAGTSYRGSTKARLRTLVALGLAGSIAGVASSASASMLAKSSWLKILAVAALGAAVMVPIVSAVVPSSEQAPPASALSTPATEQPRAPAEALAKEEPEAAVLTASPPPDAVPSAPQSQTALSKRQPLGGELATLDVVRVAIARGETKRALSLLDSYAKAYPRGRMQVEAEVLRIDAYAKNGQTERARRRAQAFLKSRPHSVFAARVQSYLRGSGPESKQN